MPPSTASTKRSKSKDRTWVVVADRAHARVMESPHQHSGITILLEVDSKSGRARGPKNVDDRLPRTQESASSARHAIAARLDPKAHEQKIFIERLARYLKSNTSHFDSLVLVAPKTVLPRITAELSPPVRKKLALEFKKDLTWMRTADILEKLGPLGQKLKKERIARLG